jgi:DNA adenine methylase
MNKPFLKWAGGKTRVMPHILPLLQKGKRLVEPFCGSCAVCLNTNYDEYILSDINKDIITLYKTLKSKGKEFIDFCKTYFCAENNTQEAYTALRDSFNTISGPYKKSALFVYLNRHGFNGLCRYNASGKFNVPFGRYDKPYFPEKEMLAFCIKAHRVSFRNVDFRELTKDIQKGDVVYCDPPYIPLTITANFTSYSKNKFGLTEQRELASWADTISKKGAPVLISNHDTPISRDLYKNAVLIKKLNVARHISCKSANRNSAKEILALFSKGEKS